jgi:ABC-type uncharacterized transport system ATPase subunit
MVHQHFMLADNLTVQENVVLGAESLHGIGGKARKRILELADATGLTVDPGGRWIRQAPPGCLATTVSVMVRLVCSARAVSFWYVNVSVPAPRT